jgi:hypothetical protein
MATVKLGILVSAIAGSVGGGTFQRDAQGTQLRSKPLPIRRRTTYTNTQRGATSYLVRQWANLTDAQRTAWDVAASGLTWYNRFGDVITGKGYWLYLRCNQYRWLIGQNFVDDYGGGETLSAYVDLACTYEATPAMLLSWASPGAVQTGTVLLLFGTPRLSMGKSAQFGQTRFLGYLSAGDVPGQDIYTLWNNRFGQVPTGSTQVLLEAIPFAVARTEVGPTYAIRAIP